MEIDKQKLKERLVEEKNDLETSLSKIGRINPDNPADWEPTAADLNILKSEKVELATSMADYERRSAIEVTLENRLVNIKKGLEDMKNGKYGICDVCGKEIEPARLNANPAARTCIEHLNN